jgi:hypothetical protein
MVSAETLGAPAQTTASGNALVISNPVKNERSIAFIAALRLRQACSQIDNLRFGNARYDLVFIWPVQDRKLARLIKQT